MCSKKNQFYLKLNKFYNIKKLVLTGFGNERHCIGNVLLKIKTRHEFRTKCRYFFPKVIKFDYNRIEFSTRVSYFSCLKTEVGASFNCRSNNKNVFDHFQSNNFFSEYLLLTHISVYVHIHMFRIYDRINIDLQKCEKL